MTRFSRRSLLRLLSALPLVGRADPCAAAEEPAFRLATFTADVTPPLGHPLLADQVPPASAIQTPLLAKGLVLTGSGEPLVLVSIDWCEIRNESYDDWREAMAEAAGTTRERVLLCAIHQHDAPLDDLAAERILRERRLEARIIDPEFRRQCVQRTADSLRTALERAEVVTHIGLGRARVQKVASNRRYLTPDGTPSFARGSATSDVYAQSQEEGTIDPWLRALSFWNGEQPLAVMHSYATHPMSFYRTGQVNYDFPGIARERMQDGQPAVLHMYFSGASGNVTAGKYNDGNPENRGVLAQRLFDAMQRAWQTTQRLPLEQVRFRNVPFRLQPRHAEGFRRQDLDQQLQADKTPAQQALAALGWSWLDRCAAQPEIDLPVIDFGPAQFVVLPAEAYVEYQLYCQQVRPDSFVVAAGYGECGPGYIPTEQHWREGDSNLHSWCWVRPGAEPVLKQAIRSAMTGP